MQKEIKIKINYCFISSVSNIGLENLKNIIWKELNDEKSNN